MKICPKCKGRAALNTYFGAIICTECGYVIDDSYRKERIKYYATRRTSIEVQTNDKTEVTYIEEIKNSNL